MKEEIKSNNYIEELVKYQQENKISQAEWAEKSGILQPQISRYKKGKSIPNINTLNKLADGLGLEMQFVKKIEK